MSVRVLLDEGSGPPVILLPGLALDERLFLPIAPRLAGRFRVVVPEIALAGSIRAMAERVFAVADQLGFDSFHLGGLSLGGYVCFEAWRLRPERLRSLVLMNTQAKGDSPAALQRRQSIIRLCEAGHFDRVVGPFLNRILAPRHAADPRLRELVLAMTGDAGPRVMAEDTRAIMERGDYNGVLQEISIPALVMGGWNDFLTPAREAERMASTIPHAELHVLDDCGHLCPVEQPRAVGGIVARFLDAAEKQQAHPPSHRN